MNSQKYVVKGRRYRRSKLGLIWPTIYFAFTAFFVVFIVLAAYPDDIFVFPISIFILVLGILSLLLFYTIASEFTISFFTNSEGVWISMGLFPWSKSYIGMKWEEVLFATSFEDRGGYFAKQIQFLFARAILVSCHFFATKFITVKMLSRTLMKHAEKL